MHTPLQDAKKHLSCDDESGTGTPEVARGFPTTEKERNVLVVISRSRSGRRRGRITGIFEGGRGRAKGGSEMARVREERQMKCRKERRRWDVRRRREAGGGGRNNSSSSQ